MWIALLVFAGAALYLAPLADYLNFNADEGLTLVLAQRILRGELPYRDFFTFLTPGSAYLMALWFKLFGSSYLVARLVLLAYAGVFAALTFSLARRFAGRAASLWAAALLIFGCMPWRFLVLHNWDSTLFALLAIYCAQQLVIRPCWELSLLLGASTSLTVLTEQSRGAGLVLGLLTAAFTLAAVDRRNRLRCRGYIFAGLAGFAIPLAITLGYFASHRAAGVMLQDWLWPLLHFNKAVNRLPYGAPPLTAEALGELYSHGSWGMRALTAALSAPLLLVPVLPVLVLGSTACAIIVRRRGGVASEALDGRIVGGCVFVGIFLAILATGRADLNHLLYATPLFIYLLPTLPQVQERKSTLIPGVVPFAASLLLISFLGFGLLTVLQAVKVRTETRTRRGTIRLAYADEVLPYADKYIRPGAHLYVHPYQPLYSWLTATQNPAPTSFLLAGMNTREQYRQVIAALEADRTPYVLFNSDFSDMMRVTWPSAPAELQADDPVEDYILSHYRTCRILNTQPNQRWRFYFMIRKELSCPA